MSAIFMFLLFLPDFEEQCMQCPPPGVAGVPGVLVSGSDVMVWHWGAVVSISSATSTLFFLQFDLGFEDEL
jgi:hypothetical protein